MACPSRKESAAISESQPDAAILHIGSRRNRADSRVRRWVVLTVIPCSGSIGRLDHAPASLSAWPLSELPGIDRRGTGDCGRKNLPASPSISFHCTECNGNWACGPERLPAFQTLEALGSQGTHKATDDLEVSSLHGLPIHPASVAGAFRLRIPAPAVVYGRDDW